MLDAGCFTLQPLAPQKSRKTLITAHALAQSRPTEGRPPAASLPAAYLETTRLRPACAGACISTPCIALRPWLSARHCVQLWDLRVKRSVQTFSEKYQVLSVAFSEAGDQVSS